MPLSHKSVYKQPQITGDCNYAEDAASGYEQSVVLDADNHSEEVVFWADPALEQHADDITDSEPAVQRQKEDSKAFSKPKIEQQKGSQPQPEVMSMKQVEKMLEERTEQFLREGYEQGRIKAEEECRSMQEKSAAKLREAELTIREAKQRSKEIVAASERKIVELSMAVAERLVYNQLEAAPETVTSIVRETMSILNGGEQVDLYVNPADLEVCLNYSDNLKEEFSEMSRLEVFPDPKLPRGSCRIESENGVAEYIIDKEKENLKQMLLKIARKEDLTQAEEEESAYDRH